MFPAYQSGREFDAELIEQLNVLPDFVAAFGFSNAKAPGFEADDFLAAAVVPEERAGGTPVVASGDRDSFQLASPTTTVLYPLRGGELARIGPEEVRERYGVDPKQCRTLSRSAVTHLINCLARPASDRNAQRNCCGGTARLTGSLRRVSFKLKLTCSASID
jgi:5'-3' exonuclease, N-terminal resolvase-like domain